MSLRKYLKPYGGDCGESRGESTNPLLPDPIKNGMKHCKKLQASVLWEIKV